MHLEKRVLVTGGAGFLGSHLCEQLLKRGCDVVCVDNFFTGAKRNIAGHDVAMSKLPEFSALPARGTTTLRASSWRRACPAWTRPIANAFATD